MKKVSIFILLIITVFFAFAGGTQEVKEGPGYTTPNIHNSYEYSQRAKNMVNQIINGGILPPGFDEITLDYESALELTTKNPEEIKEAVKTIGDAAIYMWVSGISEDGFKKGNRTQDGRKMLLRNETFDCQSSAALFCYLLDGDYVAHGYTRFITSSMDSSLPNANGQHSFPWVYNGDKYCFFDFYGGRSLYQIRVVDKPEDFAMHLWPWFDNTWGAIIMIASTDQIFPRDCDMELKKEFFPIEAKNSVKQIYQNPSDKWGVEFIDHVWDIPKNEWSKVAISMPEIPTGVKMATECEIDKNSYETKKLFFTYDDETGPIYNPIYKYKDDELDITLKCYDNYDRLTYNSFNYCCLNVNDVDYGCSKNNWNGFGESNPVIQFDNCTMTIIADSSEFFKVIIQTPEFTTKQIKLLR